MSKSGYPIGALFVLVTVCAVLAAGGSPLAHRMVRGEVFAKELLIGLGSGFFGGMLIGLIAGLFQYRRTLGILVGIPAGAVIGAAAGALALAPANKIATVAVAMTAGSGLVIGIALLMRRAET